MKQFDPITQMLIFKHILCIRQNENENKIQIAMKNLSPVPIFIFFPFCL